MADLLTKAILNNIVSKTDKYEASNDERSNDLREQDETEIIGNLNNKEVQILKTLMFKEVQNDKVIKKQRKMTLDEFSVAQKKG
ncbi:MAG: hypothetical protein LR001_07045 [Clostridiales bacterium]|nr:hypothetical protein [Clostridiales bacterium]